ncbi:MAG: Spi family protease inhibitor, partial [Bacteroidales bacterium]|nr:Spi family protease inhibitor [Bacteroidales bacterium]
MALDFFSTITKTTSEQLLAEGVSIAYCAYADEFAEPQANTVCFYVVNVGRNGFVMLSGDNRLKPILGYSYESSFSTENMPENLRDWLDVKRREISSALMSETLFASSEIIYQWNHLSEIGATMSVVVQPLLQTEWDQNSYYNQHCPVDAN